MKRFSLTLLLMAAASLTEAAVITSYVQIAPPNGKQSGGYNVGRSTITVLCFDDGTCMSTASSGGGGGSGTQVYIRNGYSARFSESFNVTTSTEALDAIFDFSYVSPSVTFATTPSATVKELGTTLTNVSLSAFTVETSSPITSVVFQRNGSGIYSVPSPTSTGGTEIYTDTDSVVNTATYRAVVSDGVGSTISNSVTFTFVYPFYYGVGAQGLTGSQVQALTKLVKTKSDTTTVTSPSTEVYYFAYPQSYGSLTSILDTNGFETISGYTQRSVSLTMLDATSQNYYIYEFNTPTTQTSFSNQYKF